MKIIDSVWFSSIMQRGQIGIVIGEDEVTKERKAYIGTADGFDQKMDEKLIAKNGAPLYLTGLNYIVEALKTRKT